MDGQFSANGIPIEGRVRAGSVSDGAPCQAIAYASGSEDRHPNGARTHPYGLRFENFADLAMSIASLSNLASS